MAACACSSSFFASASAASSPALASTTSTWSAARSGVTAARDDGLGLAPVVVGLGVAPALGGANEVGVPDLLRLLPGPLEPERPEDLDRVLRARGLGEVDEVLRDLPRP